MIDDLSSYELVHFLPFTQEVYDRLFVLHNEAWWPAQLIALLLAGTVAFLVHRDRARATAACLAAGWLFVGIAFFGFRYAELLWAAPWIGAVFGLQALLLVGSRDRFEVVRPRLGLGLFAIVVVGWAALTPAFGRDWAGVEVFAMTPDPTALATLALLCGTSRRGWFLWPIPVLWCVLSLATTYALSMA